MFEVAYTQHRGYSSNTQQDALWSGKALYQEKDMATAGFVCEEPEMLIAVADGVAASTSPAAASRFVLESLVKEGAGTMLAGKRVRLAHQRLCDKYAESAKRGSSTTLVAARFSAGRVEVVNVGDSRAYRILANGGWEQLSHDHTVLNEMIESEGLDIEEGVEYAQMYKGLAHCLTADNEEYDFPVHYQGLSCTEGDSFLLCSDGLHDTLSEAQLKALYNPALSTQAQVEAWREAVLNAGAPDNLSIIFCRCINDPAQH